MAREILWLLGDGPHHSAHRQAVEVVVDEDQHAQQHGQQLCGAPGLYGLGGPASEGLRSAALVHQIHHDAQRHQKDDDAHVAAVGQHGDDAVVCAHQRHNGVPWGKLGVQQSAHQTPQKQGRVDLLADQGPARWPRWAAAGTRKVPAKGVSASTGSPLPPAWAGASPGM